MADDEIELAWKLSLVGADEVKSKITDLHQQFNRGEITVDQYSKGMKQASGELGALTNQGQIASRMFAAQHPAINQLSRAMSGFNSVLHASLAVSNAFNLATIAMSGNSSELTGLQADAAKAQREYNAAVKQFGEDSPEAQQAADNMAVAFAKVKDAQDQMTQQTIQNSITFATSIGVMATTVISNIPKMQIAMAELGASFNSTFSKLGGGSAARAMGGIAAIGSGAALLATGGIDALIGKSGSLEDKLKAVGGVGLVGVGIALEFPEIAKLALIGTAVATATVAIILFREEIGKAFQWIGQQLAPVGADIAKFFTQDLPTWGGQALTWLGNVFYTGFSTAWQGIQSAAEASWIALKSGFLGLWNSFATVANAAMSGIAVGISGFLNGIISAVESALNAMARLSGGGGISLGRVSISAPQIPLIAAATGMDSITNGPMLILAGEGGRREHVTVTPESSAGFSGQGGGGGRGDVHIHLHGSNLWTTRDLLRTASKAFDSDLTSRGF
jgi:hypothetical protein